MKKEANYKTNSRVKGPKPRVPYLVLLRRLDSEDPSCHSPKTIRKSSFLPLLDLGRHEMSLTLEDLDLR